MTKLLSHGTTTAVYYGSIHLDATKVLVDTCLVLGQRALVGKVRDDRRLRTEAAFEKTQSFTCCGWLLVILPLKVPLSTTVKRPSVC